MYQRGKIYKIVCNKTNLTYVGSTCEPTLARRLAHHVGNYRGYLRNPELYLYTTSFECLKEDDYVIVLLENCPCQSKDELYARERYWIENTECVNKVIPLRTTSEYRRAHPEETKRNKRNDYEKHREKRQETIKTYYEKNKDKCDEYYKKLFDCECGSHYNIKHKNRHLQSKKHQAYLEERAAYLVEHV